MFTKGVKSNPCQITKKQWIIQILFIGFFIQTNIHAQAPNFTWIKTAGGTNRESLWDITTDKYGNCYVVGSFKDTTTFNGTDLISAGYTDAYIAKYNESGNLNWIKRFGGTDYDEAKCVIVDANDNILVGGAFGNSVDFGCGLLSSAGYSDIFILKLNTQGDVLWSKKAGGPGIESIEDITVDETNHIYITGGFANGAQFGSVLLTTPNNESVYVAKYSTTGNIQWANGYGGGMFSSGYAITIDSGGFLRATGRFRDQITFGQTTLYSAGDFDGFIIKQKQDGTILWAKGFGGQDNETIHGITLDSLGNSIVAGFFGEYGHPVSLDGIILNPVSDNSDILVAKYDSSGSPIWAKAAGGPFFDSAFDVSMDGSGNSYVTGRFKDNAVFGDTALTSAGEMDVVIVKYNSDGNIIWIKKAGGTNSDEGHAVVTDVSGNVFVGGFFSGSADFDRMTVNSEGDDDVFIVKLIQPLSGIHSRWTVMPLTPFLGQNYPNPFNPSTTIQFHLPKPIFVSIKIYDLLGKEVETLISEYRHAGEYKVEWNPVGFPSGMYLYRLEAGDFVETRKLILQK